MNKCLLCLKCASFDLRGSLLSISGTPLVESSSELKATLENESLIYSFFLFSTINVLSSWVIHHPSHQIETLSKIKSILNS